MPHTLPPNNVCGNRTRINRRLKGFGRARHQAPPEVPSPGRWIRSGRFCGSSVLYDCASLDWSTGPHPTLSGSGRAPTADRSKTPAAGVAHEGLTAKGPLQKPTKEKMWVTVRPVGNGQACEVPDAVECISIWGR